jgi:hypothetical protein
MIFLTTLLVLTSSATASYHPVHLSAPSEATLELHGNLLPLGIFYTEVVIGTPPRRFQVSVDTGSTDMLVPVAGCTGCKPNTTLYDPAASSTTAVELCNKTLDCSRCQPRDGVSQCSFKDSYLTCDLSNLTAICSVQGGIYRDTLSIGEFTATEVRFGGIDQQTTNFDQFQEIDGILGLAYYGDSRGSRMGFDVSPFQKLVDQNAGLANVIQTCLVPEGGLLVFGQDMERDAQFYTGELAWTPITLEAWYTVNATRLSVNEKVLDVSLADLNGPFPSDPCIVDSGTNFLSLTGPAFDAVVGAFQDLCASGVNLVGVCHSPVNRSLFDGVAYPLSDVEMSAFPTVEIDLIGDRGADDVKLPIGPDSYFVKLSSGKYRLGLTKGDCIIGNTHMLKYWTVYDRTNKRLGFAPAIPEKCSTERESLMAVA